MSKTRPQVKSKLNKWSSSMGNLYAHFHMGGLTKCHQHRWCQSPSLPLMQVHPTALRSPHQNDNTPSFQPDVTLKFSDSL